MNRDDTDHLETREIGDPGATIATTPGSRGPQPRTVTDTGSELGSHDEVLFCPVRGVSAGATQRLAAGTRRVLEQRLRWATAFFAVLMSVPAVRGMFVGDPEIVPAYATGAILMAGLAAFLWLRSGHTPRVLGAAEIATFAIALAALAATEFRLISSALQAEDLLRLARYLNRIPGIYAVALLSLVIMIPGTLRRNLAVSAAAILLAIGAAEAAVHASPSGRPVFSLAERVEYGTFALVMLATAALMATLGARALEQARRGMEEAGDAGMYRLLGKLGQGGMGEVWKAEHRLLARPAAIKIIRRDFAGPRADLENAQRRFEREARATASLQSPHTVQLYDFGVTQEGTFFYVMEFLEGLDFTELVERFGPVPPERVVFLLRQVAESLGEAHERGLVHRDVKPGNLHVGRRAGRHDWVRVLDFGLVKSFERDPDSTAIELTQEGTTTGTPAYFPPEMAQGAAAADARSDIYALSAVAYWLLTGQLVFAGNGPMDMVVRHIRDTPVPPSQRAEIEVPAPLEELVLAGLAKSPGDRPQSMAELIARLDAISLPRTWDEACAAEWWKLHRPLETHRIDAQQIA